MASHLPLVTFSGEDLHQLFMKMTITYGVMMTGARPEILGQNQAAFIYMDNIFLAADALEETIAKLVEKHSGQMLEPPDSCGYQSNQICELFLGMGGAEAFSKMQYVTCPQTESATQILLTDLTINRKKNIDILVRFELDRENPFYIAMYPDIKTIDELKNGIASKSIRIIPRALIILQGSLCFLRDGRAIEIATSPQEQNLLKSLFNAIQQGSSKNEKILYCFREELRDKELGIPSFLNAASVNSHDEEIHVIENIILKLLNDPTIDYIWIGSHSFTLFIPQYLPDNCHLYHYQALANKHSLQQWLMGNDTKFSRLSKYTLEQYAEQCGNLLSKDEHTRMKSACELFKRAGHEEKTALLTLSRLPSQKSTVAQAPQFHLKYKITYVNPLEAKRRLERLQKFFQEFGDTPEAQVANYKARAIEALKQELSKKLQPASQKKLNM